jgi:hypothetical protein
MRDDVIKQRPTWRTATAAAITGFAVLAAATGAQAHDDGEREWKHHGRYFVPPGHVYYSAPPVYYAPRYYAPRPVVVYPPPVYYEPAPVYYPPPGLNINIPLR